MKRDNNGFTLVEVMIALVITLLVFMALMQTALVSIDVNMRDSLRDEAVKIAEERLNEARNVSFDTLTSDSNPLPGAPKCLDAFVAQTTNNIGELVERNMKNIASFDFCTLRTVTTPPGADIKQIAVTVVGKWKEEPFIHTMTTIRRKM